MKHSLFFARETQPTTSTTSQEMAEFTMPPSSTPQEVEATMPLWLERVKSVQKQRQTPESIAVVQARIESRSKSKKSADHAKRLQTVQCYSKSAFASSISSLRAGSPASSQWPQLSGGIGAAVFSDSPVPASSAEADAWADSTSLAMATLQRAASAQNEEEAVSALESARVQLVSSGHAWASRGVDGAVDVATALGGVGDSQGAFVDLLGDLKMEPTDDADSARRFRLYEEHAETLSSIRKGLFAFWEGAKADVPEGAPKAAIEASLKAIDGAENLELREDRRYWFVYSMALKTSANEGQLEGVLQAVKTKLEVLANTDDCPVCLESIEANDAVALGCAHKLHIDCWRHWSAHCGTLRKAPFCPLCRSDEFLDDIL